MSEIILPADKLISPPSENKPFASVSVHCDKGACDAARELSGMRHLVDEAPALPLAQCSADACYCRYFKYGDRRSLLSNRRSNDRGRNALWQNNRRSGQERRKLKIDFRRWNTTAGQVVDAAVTP